MNRWRATCLALIASIVIYGCNGNEQEDDSNSENLDVIPVPVTLTVQILNQFKHDTSAFTEGFTFHDGKLFESPFEVSLRGKHSGNARNGT